MLNATWAYALSVDVSDVALWKETREAFLQRKEGNIRAFRFVDRSLPPSAKVLLQGIVKGYYCNREYIWDHRKTGVINYDDYDTTEALLGRLGELGISHVVRMREVPTSRLGFYPQYFADPFQETFRKQ